MGSERADLLIAMVSTAKVIPVRSSKVWRCLGRESLMRRGENEGRRITKTCGDVIGECSGRDGGYVK